MGRRSLLASRASGLVMACSRPGEGREQAANSLWAVFRSTFVDPSGRIIDTGNGGISHSEGQSYGLMLAALAGDKSAFQSIYTWTQANLAQADTGLFAWKYDPRQANPVSDPNNASDGDTLIAWALAEAARRWDSAEWRTRSAAVRAAIRAHVVVEHHGRHVLLPGRVGFAQAGQVTLNPSYFIWPALDAFAALDGDSVWGAVISDAEAIMREARFGAESLPCDWIDIGADGKVVPSRSHPPRFGYDAIRIPLYAVAGRRASLVKPIADFWAREGATAPAWIDVTTGERAPYPLSAGGKAIVRRTLCKPMGPEALDTDYFSAALQALARAL